MTYRAIDCQGFAGGFTLGVAQAGFQLVGKREMQGGFGVPNCEANRHLLGDAWQTEAVNPEEWTVPAGGANMVFGNPPCSGFSVLSSKEFRGVDSKINACMWAFSNYAAKVVPEIAIFESVQLAYSQGHSLMTSLVANLNEKTSKTYHLTHVLHNAYSVGGPAMRRRYFWVASQVPFGVERVPPAKLPVFRDVIGDLEEQPLSWSWNPYVGEPTWYSARLRANHGTQHGTDGHMALDNPLTRRVLELLEDGNWFPGEHSQAVTRRYYEKHGKLPATWEHMTDKLVKQDFFQGYNTPTMWNPENPARVITGAGLLNGVHYNQKRNFTHREAARILGFPDDWLIEPLKGNSGLFMTWGKGITVDCGRWIARWASRALDGEPGEYLGEQVGENERVIDVTNLWKNCDTVTQSATRILKQYSKITGTPRENIVTEVPVAEATETPTKSKGRPRPDETKARDEQVFAAIAGSERPVTREEIATGTGLEPKLTYLSLWRLRKAERIERTHADGKHVWGVVKTPTEAV